MYIVDAKLNFDVKKLTNEEFDSLVTLGSSIVCEGVIHFNHPAFKVWCEQSKLDNRQALLVYSTSFCQHLLFSIILMYQYRLGQVI